MSVIVTKMHRAEHGELEARLTVENLPTVPVTRRHGSWQLAVDGGLRDVRSQFARELQERARAFERQEKRDAHAAKIASLTDAQRRAYEWLVRVGKATKVTWQRHGISQRSLEALVEAKLATRERIGVVNSSTMYRPVEAPR